MRKGIRIVSAFAVLALVHLALLAAQLLHQLPVSARAQMDEVWPRLEKIMSQHLAERSGSREALVRGLAAEQDCDPYLLGELIRVALYFDSAAFRIEHYLRRYSQVSRAGVQADLERMSELGWMLSPIGGDWRISPAGESLVQHYLHRWKSSRVKIDGLVPGTAARLIPLLARPIAGTARRAGGDPSAPLPQRQESRFRYPLHSPPWATLEDLFEDLLAFSDQVDRDRFGWLKNSPQGAAYGNLELTGLELELLWGVVEGWANSQIECEKRGFWRQDRESCRGAFRRLTDLDLITGHAEGYAPSSKGRTLVTEADGIGNLVFYGPWNTLSPEEYDQFASLLEETEMALEL